MSGCVDSDTCFYETAQILPRFKAVKMQHKWPCELGRLCSFPELQKELEGEAAQSGKHGDLRSQA